MQTIPGTELSVFPLCLGGNVFGGRSTEQESFAVLDAYVEAGGDPDGDTRFHCTPTTAISATLDCVKSLREESDEGAAP